MKKLVIIFLLLTLSQESLASEITGDISTNPKDFVRLESRPKISEGRKFKDGELVRVDRVKIFLVYGRLRKLIHSPKELVKYKKQAIIEARQEELGDYTVCGCLDGELVRVEGSRPVYVLKKGKKKQIESLKMLKESYFGQRIFSISQAEMSLFLKF